MKRLIWIIAVLLLISQAAAISDMRYTLSGTKLQISYKGIAPYQVEIRGDRNLGSPGAFVTVRTYRNTFTYDLKYLPKRELYYFGAKDTAWSYPYAVSACQTLI
ncbi:MAG TPA: hypothetical protein VFF28_06775 [Candidatus Nanoarchaeia archaeon]|nr:hypothetical protein [Candidatus Nanoarchaeia archaeon]